MQLANLSAPASPLPVPAELLGPFPDPQAVIAIALTAAISAIRESRR
jgi:hypothetical protein